MIDDSPRTAVLTETDADALSALLSPRPSGSLFGPVIDLRQPPAKLQPSVKPLFDQPVMRAPHSAAPTVSKPLFERSNGVDSSKPVAPGVPAVGAPASRPRLAVQMGEAVPVGFVSAGDVWSRASSRRWSLALVLLVLLVVCGSVGAFLTLGGDGSETQADGGPSSSATSALRVSTTLATTTSGPATSVPTTAAPTSAAPTTVPTTATTMPPTVAPAVAPTAPPTTARRTTTTVRRSSTTAVSTTVVQSAPQTTVTFSPPTWSVTTALTTPPTTAPPATAPPTTAPPTAAPPTSAPGNSPPPTSAAAAE